MSYWNDKLQPVQHFEMEVRPEEASPERQVEYLKQLLRLKSQAMKDLETQIETLVLEKRNLELEYERKLDAVARAMSDYRNIKRTPLPGPIVKKPWYKRIFEGRKIKSVEFY